MILLISNDSHIRRYLLIIFIDDSGDPGFKVTKGSSAVFVIALVIFDDPLDAEETALKIKRLRQKLNRPEKFEFKFNKCSKDFRCMFLDTITGARFRVRAIVMPKNNIYGKELRRSKESFYNYAIKMVLKHSDNTIIDAKIRIDGHGDRKFKQAMNNYLRKELNSPGKTIFTNLKIIDSKENVLIQLADMVAGAIHRSYYNDKTDKDLYKSMIAEKIENEWKFGK
ncbi:MAG: DUF3800 domain-containing protein [Candidatus Acididesulfobacter diazotrophicus]|uniref:DUF3800 domain-containing protein n=1 Tax=Candidatus Acididesulfobacter diazotrophicus TaxID=2597226 RepID=A0A519BP19_9DELT|nr:MAG: DUF3800 domain-containing protein [Candidatus Acididesulfobacter diazotrophicus]